MISYSIVGVSVIALSIAYWAFVVFFTPYNQGMFGIYDFGEAYVMLVMPMVGLRLLFIPGGLSNVRLMSSYTFVSFVALNLFVLVGLYYPFFYVAVLQSIFIVNFETSRLYVNSICLTAAFLMLINWLFDFILHISIESKYHHFWSWNI